MTSKTSILLIIQQNPGMDYQTLLSKIAPNYSNLNSARAALSRVLKDAVSFGMVQRRDHQLYLTDKGMASLKVKMHDKLVLKLNQIMQTRGLGNNPDALVQHLTILLERGRQDIRLMDNARASVNFSVADITKVKESLSAHVQHLHYVEKTLDHQIDLLKELNFPSAHKLSLPALSALTPHLLSLSNASEIQFEPPLGNTESGQPLAILDGFSPTPKGTRYSVETGHFSPILSRIAAQDVTFPGVKAYVGLFTLDVGRDHVLVRGPSHLMEKLLTRAPANAEDTPLVEAPKENEIVQESAQEETQIAPSGPTIPLPPPVPGEHPIPSQEPQDEPENPHEPPIQPQPEDEEHH